MRADPGERCALWHTFSGGAAGAGTVFSLNPTTGTETVIYSFAGGADGANPYAGLTHHGGKLYGMTVNGGISASECGASGCGTVFAIDIATGHKKLLYAFQGGTDGWHPLPAPTYLDGILYGTTIYGGSSSCTTNCGTLFQVNAATGAEKVLYRFTGGSDGNQPKIQPIYMNGMLYGTTVYGGANGEGTVFAFDLTKQTETVLHSFQGADGAFPVARLAYAAGTLYSTTLGGGIGNAGTVFQMDASTGSESVLSILNGGKDGSGPTDGVIYRGGRGGNVFGTAQAGGANKLGTVFKVNTTTGAGKVLYSFKGGTDGYHPIAELLYWQGAFYGTASEGKKGSASPYGTVFKVTQ
jgi:uncharacterized repeat protein (TIGR03803 family)